jgi:hypothetical protein
MVFCCYGCMSTLEVRDGKIVAPVLRETRPDALTYDGDTRRTREEWDRQRMWSNRVRRVINRFVHHWSMM